MPPKPLPGPFCVFLILFSDSVKLKWQFKSHISCVSAAPLLFIMITLVIFSAAF
jgi:hypothetical protein